MEKITLPLVTIEKIDKTSVLITHIKTGMQTSATTKKLEIWAMQQLRRELLPSAPQQRADLINQPEEN